LELTGVIPTIDKIRLICDLITQKKYVNNVNNFEEFVTKKYGNLLHELFFRPYTEKLFGIDAKDISLQWAKNKVRLNNPFRNKKQNNKNTFGDFYYPVKGGYGVIAEKLYQKVKDKVLLESKIENIKIVDRDVTEISYNNKGVLKTYECDAVISTLPLSSTSNLLGYNINFSYRQVSSVYFWINRPKVMDYHWVYFVPDDVIINRLVEFKNLNPLNTPNKTTVICAEVTNLRHDLQKHVLKDLVKIGLIDANEVLDILVINENYGYPVYKVDEEDEVQKIKNIINSQKSIHLLGRFAEFEHMEIDDIFAKANNLINSITDLKTNDREISIASGAKKKVCICVLTYNNYHDTAECLESLLKLRDDFHTTLLIDNGSTDNSLFEIHNRFSNIETLELKENIGVPAGFNQGIQFALNKGFDYIFILNNDTVVDPEILTHLFEVAENDQDCALVMPQIKYYSPNNHDDSRENIWSDGGYYRKFPPGIVHKDRRRNINFSEPRKVEYVPTCGLLIHRRAFEKVGLFDPGYFFFFEDWDFSKRVREAGLNIWSAPKAKMWHKISKSIKVNNKLYWQTMGESTIRFYRRHYSFFSSLIQITYRIIRDIILAGNVKYWKPFSVGLKKGMRANLESYPDVSNYFSKIENE
jgi:GT2 family glycosyltransferase/protoporphyrinogen oxidase